MAVRQITYIFVGILLQQIKVTWAATIKVPEVTENITKRSHLKVPEVTENITIRSHLKVPEVTENITVRSHLKLQSILEYCKNRNEACKSNTTNICAMKVHNGRRLYHDFKNGCFLFMSNMCDHPEQEYYIITSGSCKEYLAGRRMEETQATAATEDQTEPGETTTAGDDVTETESNTETTINEETTTLKYSSTGRRNSTAHILRAFSYSPLYEVEFSHDGHACPMSCPDVYQPVCVNVNRSKGKYFKIFFFVNHCASDKYYCANWREFIPPPSEDNYQVRTSILGWSFCGAHRYIQFARFSEVVSSMGSYGWLSGNYKYSNIMQPHQIKPGFG